MNDTTLTSFKTAQPIISLDPNFNVMAFNEPAERFFEEISEPLQNLKYFPDLIPVDCSQIEKKLKNSFQGKLEKIQISKESAIHNFVLSPVVAPDGTINRISVIVESVKKVSQKPEGDKKVLRAIIDNIPDYIFVKDREHRSILLNQKFYENILKKDREELGQTPLDYFENGKGRAIVEDNERVMKTGIPVINRPDTVINKKGEAERVLLTKVPLRDENNNITGLVGIARDITSEFNQSRQRELTLRIIKAVGESLNLQEAFQKTLNFLCLKLDYQYAEAYKINLDQNKLINVTQWPCNKWKETEEPQEIHRLSELAFNTGKIQSTSLNDAILLKGKEIVSLIAIPIIFQQKPIAVICLGSEKIEKEFNKEFFEGLAVQIALIIQSKRDQDRFNDFFKYSLNPIAVLGLDGFIKMNNPSFEYKFGYSREEILRIPFTEFIHPEDLPKVHRAIKEASIRETNFEIRCRKKNGDYLWISWRFSKFFEEENVVYAFGTDITPIKEASEKLVNSQTRFKALVQEGSDIISILDCSYNYKYCSPAARLVFGMVPSQLTGSNFRDFIHEADLQDVDKALAGLQHQKRLQLPSYRIKNRSNEWRWIETIVTNLHNDPAIKGIVMNSRDITEFVEQERKLIESLDRYDIVSKATSDIITDYDIEKDEVMVNEAASKMLGYAQEEIGKSGSWWDEHIHPEDLEDVKRMAKKMRKEGLKQLSTEYRFRCADGSYKHILDRSYLITDDENNPKRIIGSMQDITERKLHLISIENHNKRLKEIAWTQSHVVRAPLAKVLGLVDLLMNYKDQLEDSEEILENILGSANELDTIIRQIAVDTEREV